MNRTKDAKRGPRARDGRGDDLARVDLWALVRTFPSAAKPQPKLLSEKEEVYREWYTQVAADGSRRCLRGGENAPTAVGGYTLSADRAGCEIFGLGVRAEAARACASTESQRAGGQGVGELGRSVCLERSCNLMDREAVATVPIPASGQKLIGPAATAEPFLFHRAVAAP